MTKDTPSDKPQKKQDVQRLGRGLSSLLGDAPAITQSTLTTNASGEAEAHLQAERQLWFRAVMYGLCRLNGLCLAMATAAII